MKELELIYKPLQMLQPLHRAVIEVAGEPLARTALIEALPLPEYLLAEVLEELLAWRLLEEKAGRVLHLTERGRRCLAALLATDGAGKWVIREPADWLLGAGKMELPGDTLTLAQTGIDKETGATLTVESAQKAVTDWRKKEASSGERIEKTIHDLAGVRAALGPPEDIVKRAFEALTRPEAVDQLADRIEREVLPTGPPPTPDLAAWAKNTAALITRLRAARVEALRHEWWQQRRARARLFAHWLGQQPGELGRLAAADPAAFRCYSNFGPTFPEEAEAGFFTRVFETLTSFFA